MTHLFKLYKTADGWFFDDPDRGIQYEAFVRGVPEIIETLVGPDANLIDVVVSTERMLAIGTKILFNEVVSSEPDEVYYRLENTNLRGWFCPTFWKYFDKDQGAPKRLWIHIRTI